ARSALGGGRGDWRWQGEQCRLSLAGFQAWLKGSLLAGWLGMTKHQTGLADSPPLVHLERERRIDRFALGDAKAASVAESDPPRVRSPRFDREASVLAFAHRAHIRKDGILEHQRNGRVAAAERSEHGQLLG